MTRANLNKARYTDAKTVDYYNTAYGFLPCEAYVFDKFIQQKDCILDLGVGGGRTTAFLSNKGGKYIGIDFSQPMIDVCCKKFPGLEFYCEDASDLRRFDDGTFDVVVFSFNGILRSADQRGTSPMPEGGEARIAARRSLYLLVGQCTFHEPLAGWPY